MNLAFRRFVTAVTDSTARLDLQRVIDNVTELFGLLDRVPILKGRLLTGVIVSTGGTHVAHGLGRRPLGWIVVRSSNGTPIFDQQDDNGTPEKTLILRTSVLDATVSLWVF